MLQLILMLLGLAFSNNNTTASTSNNTGTEPTTQTTPGEGSEGSGDDTGGNTGQKPPLSDPGTNP
ncbi:hypothetical protein [Chryseobacterium phocaeense]|uniref:hypothetical protein n=1 Tax=Chryseobacterium phocaeense TaxID=1816690 RepID=UPI0011180472|nr:hypothetical protein [Chryseobacterium phocaeense]